MPKFCPSCGAKALLENTKFCMECGASFRELDRSSNTVETEENDFFAEGANARPQSLENNEFFNDMESAEDKAVAADMALLDEAANYFIRGEVHRAENILLDMLHKGYSANVIKLGARFRSGLFLSSKAIKLRHQKSLPCTDRLSPSMGDFYFRHKTRADFGKPKFASELLKTSSPP